MLDRPFAEVQRLAHIGSWEFDPETRQAYWSDELCRIFGRPEGHHGWDEFLACVHPDDRATVDAALGAALVGGVSETAYRIFRPDGEIRHLHARRHDRVDGGGQISRLYGTMQDVTDRHRAEQAQHEARELFEAAFTQAPSGMALVALDGRWLKVNAAICRMIGYTEAQLLSLTFQEVTHPDDLDADLAQLRLLLAGEMPGYQIEKRYLTHDGAEIWVSLAVSLAYDPDGRPSHLISQIQDISLRRRAEDLLRQAERESRTQRDYATAIIGAMHDGYALTVEGRSRRSTRPSAPSRASARPSSSAPASRFRSGPPSAWTRP